MLTIEFLMPLLKAEPNLYPPLLLDEPATADFLGDRQWWAVYTMSRQEKALMRSLLSHQIPFYCPLAEHQYRSPGGRRRTSYLPLFSNYVFMRAGEDQRYLAVASGCVSKCLPIDDPELFISQMRVIARFIASDIPLTIESKWQPGTIVRLKNGPMEGISGTIIERRGNHRLLVEVTMLSRAVSISIEDWEVERL